MSRCSSLLVLGLSSVLATNKGSINIEGYGEVFLIAPDWAPNITVAEDSFTINGYGRVTFAKIPTDGFEADAYWKADLMGKKFSYTVDLSGVGCHCNANGYFVGMPAPSAGDSGDFYCDAQMGGGNWCPEYDVFEGNKYTVMQTIHHCNATDGVWDTCDRSGCSQNIYNVDEKAMCPDESCGINTLKPFRMTHYQDATSATITVEQGESVEYTYDVCQESGVLDIMADSYNGMVFIASVWGGPGIDMGWLDGVTGCEGVCDVDSSIVTFSDFALVD